LLLGVLAEPIEVDFLRVVSTHGSVLDVSRLSIEPKESTDCRPSNAESLSRFLVGPRESLGVGCDDSLTESDRDHLHFRSEFSDLFQGTGGSSCTFSEVAYLRATSLEMWRYPVLVSGRRKNR